MPSHRIGHASTPGPTREIRKPMDPEAQRKRAEQLVRAVTEVENLRKTPGRGGAELLEALKREAAERGYRSYELYALLNLRHPGEIREFVRHYLAACPVVAAENIRFAAGSWDQVA